jgi:hypothetical protein
VKHFKTLVTPFSARVSFSTGVWTKAVTSGFSRHGALGSYRICACCGTAYSGGIHCRETARISPWTQSAGCPISKFSLSMGKTVVSKKALSRVKIHLVGCPEFARSRILPECLRPSAAVRGGHLSTLQRLACLTEAYGASCILPWTCTHTNCKLCVLWAIGTNR